MEQWFAEGIHRLHCLPWDAQTGFRWAALKAALHRSGRTMPAKDSPIATTALFYDLTLATRNRADFEAAGVRLVDPFLTDE